MLLYFLSPALSERAVGNVCRIKAWMDQELEEYRAFIPSDLGIASLRMGFNIPALVKPPEGEMFSGEQGEQVPKPPCSLSASGTATSGRPAVPSPFRRDLSPSHLRLEMYKHSPVCEPVEWWESPSKAAVWPPAAW